MRTTQKTSKGREWKAPNDLWLVGGETAGCDIVVADV